MPQIIDIPDIGRVEFPDGMTDEQIISAIQNNLSAPTGVDGSPSTPQARSETHPLSALPVDRSNALAGQPGVAAYAQDYQAGAPIGENTTAPPDVTVPGREYVGPGAGSSPVQGIAQFGKDTYATAAQMASGAVKTATAGAINFDTGRLNVPFTNKGVQVLPPLKENLDAINANPAPGSGVIGGLAGFALPGGAFNEISKGVEYGAKALNALRTGKKIAKAGEALVKVNRFARAEKLAVDMAKSAVSFGAYNAAYTKGDPKDKETILHKALVGATVGAAFHLGAEAAGALGKAVYKGIKYKNVNTTLTPNQIVDALTGKRGVEVPEEVMSYVKGMSVAERKQTAKMAQAGLGDTAIIIKSETVPRFGGKAKTPPTEATGARVAQEGTPVSNEPQKVETPKEAPVRTETPPVSPPEVTVPPVKEPVKPVTAPKEPTVAPPAPPEKPSVPSVRETAPVSAPPLGKQPWEMKHTEKADLMNKAKILQGVSGGVGGDLDLRAGADIGGLIALNPHLTVRVKDSNGWAKDFSVKAFGDLVKNKAFDDRIRWAHLLTDKPSRFPETFMGVKTRDNGVKSMPPHDVPIPIIKPLKGVEFRSYGSIRADTKVKIHEAFNNSKVRGLLRENGITSISVEAPYKFSLSEQGNTKGSHINISADVEDPLNTILHEIGHKKAETLNPNQEQAFMDAAKADGNIAIEGYRKLGKADEVYAETFAHQGEEWADNLLKTAEGPTPAKPPVATGKTVKATTEKGTAVDTQYAVVDAEDLITSHDTELRKNPEYPQELQPRERGRVASRLQVDKIVQTLEPSFLGESPKASDGAPIIGPDNVVESGNGRVIALKKIYENNHPNGQKYKDFLKENADRFGFKPEDFTKVKRPLLVRVRKTNIDRVKFTREANEQSVASMSALEQAQVDADHLTSNLVTKYHPREDGEINSRENRDFIREFIQKAIPQQEYGRYLTKDGGISQDGITRIRNAVFLRAYGDADALSKLAESTDNNTRNIVKGMMGASRDIMDLTSGVENGYYYPVGIKSDIAKASNTLSQLRIEGKGVKEYFTQTQMFDDGLSALSKDILNIFDTYKRSPRKITAIFKAYADIVKKMGSPKEADMFGRKPPTKAEILQKAVDKTGVQEGAQDETSLFKSGSGKNEDVGHDVGKGGGPQGGQGGGGQADKKTSKDIVFSILKDQKGEVDLSGLKDVPARARERLQLADSNSATYQTVNHGVEQWRVRRNYGLLKAKVLRRNVTKMLPSLKDREPITHALEDPSLIADLTPKQKAVLEGIQTMYASYRDSLSEAGILDKFIENYVNHIVTESPKKGKIGKAGSGGNLGTKPGFARQRVRAEDGSTYSIKDLQAMGYKVETDPATLASIYQTTAEEALANKALVDLLREAKLPDGKTPVLRPFKDIPMDEKKDYLAVDEMQLKKWSGIKLDDNTTKLFQLPTGLHKDAWSLVDNILRDRRPPGAAYKMFSHFRGQVKRVIMFNPLIHGFNTESNVIMAMGHDYPKRFSMLGHTQEAVDALERDAVLDGLQLMGLFDVKKQLESDIYQMKVPTTTDLKGMMIHPFRTLRTYSDALLWDKWIKTGQMAVYATLRERGMKAGMSKAEAGHAAAMMANDFLGTLPSTWFTKGQRKVMFNLMFARNWTVSNLRTLTGALPGKLPQSSLLPKFLRFENVTDKQTKFMAKQYRLAILKGVIGSVATANAVQAIFLKAQGQDFHPTWKNEKGHWMDIDTGMMDNKGRKIFIRNWLFRQIDDYAKMMEGHFIDYARSKSEPILRTVAEIILNTDYRRQRIVPKGAGRVRAMKEIGKYLVKGVTPLDSFLGREDDVRSWAEALLPLTGTWIRHGLPTGSKDPEINNMMRDYYEYAAKQALMTSDMKAKASKLMLQGRDAEARALVDNIHLTPRQYTNIKKRLKVPHRYRIMNSRMNRFNPVFIKYLMTLPEDRRDDSKARLKKSFKESRGNQRALSR